jgi:hypothetical protein
VAVEVELGTHDVGDTVVFRATFSDVAGGTSVSTGVRWRLRTGYDGAVTTYTEASGNVANPSSNVWTCVHTLAAAGRLLVEAKSTAGLGAVVAGHVVVRPSAFD